MILKAHSALPFADVPIELLSTLRHSFLVHVRGRSCSAGSRQECRKSSRFETRPTVGTAQPCINIAGWPVALSCSSARMDHRELRTRIRLLMASGELPPGGVAGWQDSSRPGRPGNEGCHRTINVGTVLDLR